MSKKSATLNLISSAVYEARQFINPHNISYLVSHNPPTLTQLNSFTNTMIYEVGYLFPNT